MLKLVHSFSVAWQFNEVVKRRNLLSSGERACKQIPIFKRISAPTLPLFSVYLLNKRRVELDFVV